ncbi:MAG: GSCFA domain-containing protein [Tannerella sp.]|nr:GSCFA domain-containing protein [Tannerella sp.]
MEKDEFFTRIDIRKSLTGISYHDSMLLFGSCFAENIGRLLTEGKFKADVNPFGVLYNPASVALAVRRLLQPKEQTVNDLFFHEGLYHSFEHHGSFSAVSETGCLRKINERLRFSSVGLQQINRLLVTWGTAYVYRLKATGQVVANCHKLPNKLFIRERLSVSQIVEEWDELLTLLWRKNPELKALFTVSPVRHRNDGGHENQLSKSILLLAVEQLQLRYPGQIMYFPAYELMMDELRDYRFYAEDMCHPSETAIQYIWARFVETYMEEQTRSILKSVSEVQKALNHKPLNPENDSYKQFLMQTLLKIERLRAKTPYLCFEKEIEKLKIAYEI